MITKFHRNENNLQSFVQGMSIALVVQFGYRRAVPFKHRTGSFRIDQKALSGDMQRVGREVDNAIRVYGQQRTLKR